MTRNKTIAVSAGLLALLLLALAAAFYASPYWSVHQLKQAARERDVDALLEHVDQKALRQSVRLALGFQLAESIQGSAGEGARPMTRDSRESRDIALNTTLDPMTEMLSSPTLLMAMLLEGHPSRALSRGAPPLLILPETVPGDWPAEIRYLDRSTVEVRPKGGPDGGAFVLRRSGIVDWRLSGLRPPDR
jgi:hypothetical protein